MNRFTGLLEEGVGVDVGVLVGDGDDRGDGEDGEEERGVAVGGEEHRFVEERPDVLDHRDIHVSCHPGPLCYIMM